MTAIPVNLGSFTRNVPLVSVSFPLAARRQSFYNWLVTRHQYIVRSEENFAERVSITFTNGRLIGLISILLIIVFSISIFLTKRVLSRWDDPDYELSLRKQELVSLSVQIDSLEYELEQRDEHISAFQTMLMGGEVPDRNAPVAKDTTPDMPTVVVKELADEDLAELDEADQNLRAEFEQGSELVVSTSLPPHSDLSHVYLMPPVNGYGISQRFNPAEGHFGLDILARPNEHILAVADGTVIEATWTLEGGYVTLIQHEGNLVSVYKHNSVLFAKVGTFVYAGDLIALLGNTGELSSGPHLHFELWYEGTPVNPEYFVSY